MYNTLRHFKSFARSHDDVPAFHAGYLVLVLLAAALFHLGTFALLIVLHMCLDFFKYREVHHCSLSATAQGMLRESLLDITLLVVGLVFAVYLHEHIGITAFSGVIRADIVFARFLATVLPRAAILHGFLKILSHLRHYVLTVHAHMNAPWSSMEQLCFFFLGTSLLLLLIASQMLNVSQGSIVQILLQELHPLRM